MQQGRSPIKRVPTWRTGGGRRAILLALAIACGWPGAARAGAPVRLAVAFDHAAALGGTTALRTRIDIDVRRVPSPVSAIRLLYPESLTVTLSGLGIETCQLPAASFTDVLLDNTQRFACPTNAVLGYGTARANVDFSDGQVVPEYAEVTLLSGPVVHGAPGLVVHVAGDHPFAASLVYGGRLAPAQPPFGGAFSMRLPQIPSIGFARVALTNLRLAIGARQIIYVERVHGRTHRYRPDAIPLPNRCPKGGFRFRVQVRFLDKRLAGASSIVRCPRSGKESRLSRSRL
jgi:hypothetical protein